jgi:alpha-beta hydrolase superfamily lysophospholipase
VGAADQPTRSRRRRRQPPGPAPSGRPAWRRARRLVLALVTVAALAAFADIALRDEPSAPPEPGAFYDPPHPLPSGTPGTLLRAQAVEDPPAGTLGFRILYRSRSRTGKPAALSALLFVPRRPPPPSRRDIVAVTHPTVGVARRCAVSFDRTTWPLIAGLQQFIAAGDAVVVPDFEGLGTRGTHPYLAGPSEASATLDAVRATAAFGPAGASMRFVAWGPGTGGQAALFTGQQAPRYAPELELAGVATAAPATDLRRLLRRTRNTTFGRVVSAYTLATWPRIYGLRADEILAPSARRTIRRLADECIAPDMARLGGDVDTSGLSYRRPDPWNRAPWRDLLDRNSPGATAIAAPVYVAQGRADELVRPAATRAFTRRLCAAGTLVQYRAFRRATHADIARRSAGAVARWTADRFAGRAAPTSC